MRGRLKFLGCDAGLLAEIAAEIGRIFKTERMRDLFDARTRVHEIALRLAYQLVVDERQRRMAELLTTDAAQLRRGYPKLFRVIIDRLVLTHVGGDQLA